MTDMIRCPGCRGAKKVPKLGGMIGDCNMCLGKGEILEANRPVMIKVESSPFVADIIAATSQALPVSENVSDNDNTNDTDSHSIESEIPAVKVDHKKTIFKHKTKK